jgi:hypothetical protein
MIVATLLGEGRGWILSPGYEMEWRQVLSCASRRCYRNAGWNVTSPLEHVY